MDVDDNISSELNLHQSRRLADRRIQFHLAF
jgi:hypothetical protein